MEARTIYRLDEENSMDFNTKSVIGMKILQQKKGVSVFQTAYLQFVIKNDVFCELELSLNEKVHYYIVSLDAQIGSFIQLIERSISTFFKEQESSSGNQLSFLSGLSLTELSDNMTLYTLLANAESDSISVFNSSGDCIAILNVEYNSQIHPLQFDEEAINLNYLEFCLHRLKCFILPKGLNAAFHRQFIQDSLEQISKEKLLKRNTWSGREMLNLKETMCYVQHLKQIYSAA
jgi:hypothetical protein